MLSSTDILVNDDDDGDDDEDDDYDCDDDDGIAVAEETSENGPDKFCTGAPTGNYPNCAKTKSVANIAHYKRNM